jgi:asparagine synthase (glutamine-hydrolysing)
MQDVLPNAITWRKDKVGYEPPQQQWMQHPSIVEAIHESRKKLVQQGVLNTSILSEPIKAQAAHDAGNDDWKFLCAAKVLNLKATKNY